MFSDLHGVQFAIRSTATRGSMRIIFSHLSSVVASGSFGGGLFTAQRRASAGTTMITSRPDTRWLGNWRQFGT